MNKSLSWLFYFLFAFPFLYPITGFCTNQFQIDSIFLFQHGNSIDTVRFINNFSNIVINFSDNKENIACYSSGISEVPQDISVGKNLIIIQTDHPRFLEAKWIELRFFGNENILKLAYLNKEETFNLLPESPTIETDIYYPTGLSLKPTIIDQILDIEKKEYRNSSIRFKNEMQGFQEFIDFYTEYNGICSIPFRLILCEYLKKYPIIDKETYGNYVKLLYHLREEKDYLSFRWLNRLLKGMNNPLSP